MSADPLAPAVRQLFAALTHAGASAALQPPGDRSRWVSGEAGHERHGTRVRFMLRLQGRRLLEVRYQAYGCPHTLAACEWLALRLEGGRLGEPAGTPPDWAQQLQVPPAKLGRLLVVEDALQAALAAADKPVTDS